MPPSSHSLSVIDCYVSIRALREADSNLRSGASPFTFVYLTVVSLFGCHSPGYPGSDESLDCITSYKGEEAHYQKLIQTHSLSLDEA